MPPDTSASAMSPTMAQQHQFVQQQQQSQQPSPRMALQPTDQMKSQPVVANYQPQQQQMMRPVMQQSQQMMGPNGHRVMLRPVHQQPPNERPQQQISPQQ